MINITLKTKAVLDKTLETMLKIENSQKELYNAMSSEVSSHAKSKYSIPEITKSICDSRIKSTSALKLLANASFEGQKLTNMWNIFYAPKFNEIFYDSKSLIQNLRVVFNEDENIQEVKTSAEKNRQFDIVANKCLESENNIHKINDSIYYLGKYIESIMYSIDRLQKMVDSLDRMASKEIWVENNSSIESAIEIINNNNNVKNKSNDFDEFEDF